MAPSRASLHIFDSKTEMGRAAGARAGAILRQALAARGRARIIVGTGPSQNETIAALTAQPDVDWGRVEVFHMDEYVGMADTHPASFRRWLRERVVDIVHPAAANYMLGDAADADAECRRYAALLAEAPIDITFIGFGENGHIAFNDPGVARFDDPVAVKRVAIDERCRLQQVGEGHFENLAAVPPEALTVTCPVLVGAAHLICTVPDRRKAEAVRNAVEGPLSEACPASLVMTHPDCALFLDRESASLLSRT